MNTDHVSLASFVVMERLQKRRRSEYHFIWLCRSALFIILGFIAILFGTMIGKGSGVFFRTEIDIAPIIKTLPPNLQRKSSGILAEFLIGEEKNLTNGTTSSRDFQAGKYISNLVNHISLQAYHDLLTSDPAPTNLMVPKWVLANESADIFYKKCFWRRWLTSRKTKYDEAIDLLADDVMRCDAAGYRSPYHQNEASAQVTWRLVFNHYFFRLGDSQEPEKAGIMGAALGSLYCLLIALSTAVPLALASAIYLELFAPKKRWLWLLEVHINNLASVPSIVYGLLGLSLFLNGLNLPRASSWAGGLTLGMIVLPILIVTYRLSLRAFPSTVAMGALALGANRLQLVFHHILPGSLAGIATGTLLAIGRILGESAPLLMLGMVAFIPALPQSFNDPVTTLPVLILNWSRSPVPGFSENAAALVVVMLVLLIMINKLALHVRDRHNKKYNV